MFHSVRQAWNVRPKSTNSRWVPTAEFVESFLIFFYGSTNIFLEHLGSWGGAWSFEDLEHISITVLFIGGGLVCCSIPFWRHNLASFPQSYGTPQIVPS